MNEIKNTNSINSPSYSYTWYYLNSTQGEHGIGDIGSSKTTGYQNDSSKLIEGSDSCFDVSRCDTSKFVDDINKLGLCGYNDWRLPTWDELGTTIAVGPLGHGNFNIKIFPYNQSSHYWTISENPSENKNSLMIDYYYGVVGESPKSSKLKIRLVRGQYNEGTNLQGTPTENSLGGNAL